MKSKKKLLIITSVIMVALLLAIQPILAWFYQYRIKILLTTGDVELSVEGWSQVATDETMLTYPNQLTSKNSFNYKDVSMDNFIAFKFLVKNKKPKDALLSVRLSNFSEYIFDNFDEFRSQKNSGAVVISEPLRDAINASAESNTAKIATIIDMVYYYDIDGSKVELNFTNQYTWMYSNGKYIFDDIFLPGVITKASGEEVEYSVELYFSFRSSNDSNSIEEYKKWLLGYTDDGGQHHVGYGQDYLANHLGYTYQGLPDGDKTIVNQYLEYFVNCEFESVRTIGAEGLALINLAIDYFEFRGNSVRA